MMTPPIIEADAESVWRFELNRLLAEIESGEVGAITPDRLPVHLGPVPPALFELASHVARRIDEVAVVVQTQLDEIDDELRTTATRGSRRWSSTAPVPSQLDCSA